ncbi:MAG: hypothetical protein GY724_02255 [Actinomycetia bacterium]|nr:hypothetical protein [Actinomycetes bacterium]
MRPPIRDPGAPKGKLGELHLSHGAGPVELGDDDSTELIDEYAVDLGGDVFRGETHGYEYPVRLDNDDSDLDGYDHEGVEEYESTLVWYARRAGELILPVLDRIERVAIGWMAHWSIRVAEISLGVIYIWFGLLKFAPDLSPAEELVEATVTAVSSATRIPFPTALAFGLLAMWEVMTGLGFVIRRYRRIAIWMLIPHLLVTALPLVLVPELVWTRAPLGLTMEGQYIITNLVLFSAGLVVGAATRTSELGLDAAGRSKDEPHSDSEVGGLP